MSAGAAGTGFALTGQGSWRPLLALAVLTVVWGFSVPVMKLGLADVPPFALVSLRYVCAAPFFVPFVLGRRLPRPRVLATLIGLAALGVGAGQVLQILGVQRSSAAIGTIITATIPIFTVVFAVVRLRQPVRLHHMAGLAVALIGIALTTIGAGSGIGGFTVTAAIGDLCLLLSSICIAAYYVFSAEVAFSEGVMAVSAWTTIFGGMLLAPVALWTAADVRWTPLGIGTVVYLGLLVTVLGVWIWLHALRALPVRVAASSQYVQPLIGIAASAAIFGTPLGGLFAFGSALVLAGITLCSLSRRAAR
ncbi:MAG TPA: DMT family transporter [Acetobacteraceae bacterium]|nr:DMT family transporter [Acetobacteraceae bacterium]